MISVRFLLITFLNVVSLLNTSVGHFLNETQDKIGNENVSTNPLLRKSSGSYNNQHLNFTTAFGSPNTVDYPNAEISGTIQTHKFQNDLRENFTSRSQAKCQEYCNNIISGTSMRALLSRTKRGMLNFNTTAGPDINQPSIVRGKDAPSDRYCHVVALGRRSEENKFILLCGGTLISPNWVLTAAHCTHGISGRPTLARLGSQRLSGNRGKFHSIMQTVRHPLYKPPAMYADIALLKLATVVIFSRTIKPACLHQQHHDVPTTGWIVGWGATEFGGTANDKLQEAEIDFIDNAMCASKHNRSTSVPEGIALSMICAGAPRNNWQQDTCHGDSGGPLEIFYNFYPCFHEIVGITSFGNGCAFPNSPGVYTRVSHYIDWIEDIVWPENSHVNDGIVSTNISIQRNR